MLNKLGERLAKVLDNLGINQAEAAQKTGVSKATISHIIRNNVPTYKNSSALAIGLGINHDWLVFGQGGILNPKTIYVPVLLEYFRLRLFHSELFLEDKTRYLVTERMYGDGLFATVLSDKVLLCSRTPESYLPTERPLGFLLWTERRKTIIHDPEQVQGKRVFLIHETRQYDEWKDFFVD
ncbi:helix-turn-helix domain-containing protein [Serratia symbiotica]|uniref:Helix-turn-helix transcriptional regulator n=1 Tax=Serratia symbiotica TaxID=138074 RepID=A0A068Z9N1_9GAMM|nr:helix-turn-helix transcriptional regulator [Serratia symbiotica]QLH64455.1 helix-turn-helix transcriptional regulator [Serratia symbiotica]CDS57606.1 putative transcriptional regulatory protein [Serratia symbiotica]